METIIHKLRIQHLEAQVALRGLICSSIADQFENVAHTVDQGSDLANIWEATLKERYVLQLILELLERQERGGKRSQLNPGPVQVSSQPNGG